MSIDSNTLSSQHPDVGDRRLLLSSFSTGKLRQEKGLLQCILLGSSETPGAYQHLAVGGQNSDSRDNLANYRPTTLGSFTWCRLFVQQDVRAALGFSSTFPKL